MKNRAGDSQLREKEREGQQGESNHAKLMIDNEKEVSQKQTYRPCTNAVILHSLPQCLCLSGRKEMLFSLHKSPLRQSGGYHGLIDGKAVLKPPAALLDLMPTSKLSILPGRAMIC